MSEFRFDHWPVSLAAAVPFGLVVAGRALWLWAAERRAVRRALRELLGSPAARGDAPGERAS